MKKVILCCCAALLAACSADELATGGGAVSPPSGEILTSGTVKFTNNTSLTIGSGHALTRSAVMTRGAAFDMTDNEACKLDIPVEPTLEEIEAAAGTPITDYSMSLNALSKSVSIGENGIATIGESGLSTSSAIYVLEGGKVVVNGVCSGGGSIIVLAGGTLEYNVAELSDFKVYNYGGTVTLQGDLAIAESAEFYTTGDLDMTDNKLTVNGKCYVGGDLTCKAIMSAVDGAQTHVIGNVDVNAEYISNVSVVEGSGEANITDGADVCVEGAMTVYSLTASRGAHVHMDCKLVAKDDVNSSINITNGATLCATYVETELLHVSGGAEGDVTYVYLSDGGVMKVDKLNLGNKLLLAAYGYSKALVSANTVTIEGGVKWENIVDPTLYVNYDELWADANPVDMSKINVATMGEEGAACSPGFTVEGGEEPDPEPTPGDGDFVIEIPTWVVDDYTLRADDFAIRVNGEYVENIKVEGNTASLGDIQIVDDRLTITVSGLSEENILPGNDYTYEVWMWVNNTTLLNDGTGGYGPLFDAAKYAEWVNPTNPEDPYSDDDYGCDITSMISPDQVWSPAGYVVRYNVYRGLNGHVDKETGYGDTPYIKVSIHVQRDATAVEDTNVGIYPTLGAQ